MRNGGILGGLFPDADQDLAFRDLASFGEPAWAQVVQPAPQVPTGNSISPASLFLISGSCMAAVNHWPSSATLSLGVFPGAILMLFSGALLLVGARTNSSESGRIQ